MAKRRRKDSKITTLHVIMLLIGLLAGFYLPQLIGGFSLSPLLKTEEASIPEISTDGFEITEVELQENRVSYTSNCRQIFFDVHEMQAFAIDKAMKKELYVRPLTQDLMADFIESFGITVEQIRIDRYENQIYYATIFASQKGKLISFDSRPSDATALAFKLDKSVYFNSTILQEQGVNVC